MPQQYSTGSVLIYTATGSGGQPELFGACEDYPRMVVDTKHGQVRTDLTGEFLSRDHSFAGQEATISLLLSWWDERIGQRLEKRPGPQSSNVPGQWKQSDIGTLLLQEGETFDVWIRYFFGSVPTAKAAYSAFGLPPGYHFPTCFMLGPWENTVGARPMKRQLTFRALADVDGDSVDPTWVLYDQDFTAISGIPISFSGY